MIRCLTRAALPVVSLVVLIATANPAQAIFAVTEPWVRADANGRSAEVFMKVRSSDAAMLIGVDSFAARAVSIRIGTTNTVAAMLDLPAGATVELKPGTTRLQLIGLVRRLKPGEYVPLTLSVRLANGSEQKYFVNAEVRQRSPTDDESIPHRHSPHKH